MIVVLYFVIGAVLSFATVPRFCIKFAAKEWPSLPWEMSDTFCVLLIVCVMALVWPLLVILIALTVPSKALHSKFLGVFEKQDKES